MVEVVVGDVDLGAESLDFLVGVELGGFFLEEQICADAAFGEFAHAVVIIGAVGVGVEVERAEGVAVVGEELDEEETLFDVGGAEAEVLVVAAGLLVVEVDVEEFAGFEGLGDMVGEVQAGNRFVGDFRVHADHFGEVEGFDEGEHVAGGGEVDVAARFVGFGFEGEAVVVVLVHGVLAEEVECVAEVFEAAGGVFAGVGFRPFAAAPEDIGFGAEFRTKVHGGHGFLQGIGRGHRHCRW